MNRITWIGIVGVLATAAVGVTGSSAWADEIALPKDPAVKAPEKVIEISVTAVKPEFAVGDPLEFTVKARNVSAKAVGLYSIGMFYYGFEIQSADGQRKYHAIHLAPKKPPALETLDANLQPGETVDWPVSLRGYSFLRQAECEYPNPSPNEFVLPGGDYVMRFTLNFEKPQELKGAPAWVGRILTPPAPFKVAGPPPDLNAERAALEKAENVARDGAQSMAQDRAEQALRDAYRPYQQAHPGAPVIRGGSFTFIPRKAVPQTTRDEQGWTFTWEGETPVMEGKVGHSNLPTGDKWESKIGYRVVVHVDRADFTGRTVKVISAEAPRSR